MSSFKEFWAVRAVRIIFFYYFFLIGKTDEKLDFLYIVASILKKLDIMSICAKKCLIRRGSNRSIS